MVPRVESAVCKAAASACTWKAAKWLDRSSGNVDLLKLPIGKEGHETAIRRHGCGGCQVIDRTGMAGDLAEQASVGQLGHRLRREMRDTQQGSDEQGQESDLAVEHRRNCSGSV